MRAAACPYPTSLFLARLPARIATLYLRAAKRRETYIDVRNRINEFIPVVGLLWPVEKAAEFLAWSEQAKLPGHPNPRSDDAVVGRWAAVTKQTTRFLIPNLVDHPDMEPSTIGRLPHWGQDRGRTALMFP